MIFKKRVDWIRCGSTDGGGARRADHLNHFVVSGFTKDVEEILKVAAGFLAAELDRPQRTW